MGKRIFKEEGKAGGGVRFCSKVPDSVIISLFQIRGPLGGTCYLSENLIHIALEGVMEEC